VNYHSVVDAEQAFETLNYMLLKGKPVRIMWSHRDPSIRKSGVGNIFIKNLDKTFDNKQLYDTFVPYGKILSCKVVTDSSGTSRGFGFIHYEKQEEADLAIEKVNNMMLAGKQVYVGPFIPKKDKHQAAEKFTNVYVKNLDPAIDDVELISIFEKFGKITKAAVMRTSSGSSRGFGFVNFSDPAEAQAAVAGLAEQEIHGKVLYVGRAQKKSERENELRQRSEQKKLELLNKFQGSNLYIKNLDDSIDDERLRTEFAQFGTITSCKVMRDDKQNSRGFGFVCFSNPEEATKSITEMNGRILISKPIYVAHAQRREDRRALLEAKYLHSQSGPRPIGPPQSLFPPPTANSPAVFYSPGAPIPAPRGQNYVYAQPMMSRNRWPAGPPGQQPQAGPSGSYQPGPNFPMSSQRPQRSRQRNAPQGNVSPSAGGRGNQGNRRNFKYTTNVRNYPQSQQADQGGSVETGVDATGPKVSISSLAAGNPEESKMVLGETLYPLISVQEPMYAAKITGMLLESLDISELIHLVESNEDLLVKIAEARAVLQAHVEGVSGDGPQ